MSALPHPLDATRDATRDAAEDAVRVVLAFLGQDVEREGLVETPRRVCSALQEMTAGYTMDAEQVLSTDFDGDGYDGMIVTTGIEFVSLCEHHLLPFTGQAVVGYLPAERIVGLSKLARVVEVFARRLQVQERMTAQIADAIEKVLSPQGVGVMVRAHHSCMSCRGVKQRNALMTTSTLRLGFNAPTTRAEFLSLARDALGVL